MCDVITCLLLFRFDLHLVKCRIVSKINFDNEKFSSIEQALVHCTDLTKEAEADQPTKQRDN